MFYLGYGDPPPLGILLITLILLSILVFALVRCDNNYFQEHWANKTVIVNAINEEGVVVGGGNAKGIGRMLYVKLKNSKVLYISADQVTLTTKQNRIQEIESEIVNKQEELKHLKETK